MAAYRPRLHGDAGHRVARMATRACRRAAAVRPARERDAAGSHATRRTTRLERRERLGVHTGRPPGSGAVRHPGAGGMTVAVVLHEPQDLVNIAHVVRALKNFGFRDLRLVSPREYDPYRVEGIAHQTQDVLARVVRCDRLEDALLDCVHVVGFTARGRAAKRNLQRPREAAAEILARAEAGPAALLFGREDKGLTNEALDRCHRVVTIPASPAYSSLNLAHAVVLMLYELALVRGDEATPFKPPRRQAGPARVEDLERLCADVEQALRLIEFFKTRDVDGVMRTVREVMHRAPLDEREVKLLRAMAIEVVKYAERLARSRVHVHR